MTDFIIDKNGFGTIGLLSDESDSLTLIETKGLIGKCYYEFNFNHKVGDEINILTPLKNVNGHRIYKVRVYDIQDDIKCEFI
ncbi:MAG: hypothetical protein H8D94_00060 [Candidatus Pelagibacter sp.]|nr:hypothetical protein [Candidatus Pelagibacter sp.]